MRRMYCREKTHSGGLVEWIGMEEGSDRKPGPAALASEATPQLRPSEDDVQRVIVALREQLSLGRLDLTQFEQRVSSVYSASTLTELRAQAADLEELGRTDDSDVRAVPRRKGWLIGCVAAATALVVIAGVSWGLDTGAQRGAELGDPDPQGPASQGSGPPESAVITQIESSMRCDRPPQLRFSVFTSDPSVVFIRFYIGDQEVMAAGSPMDRFTHAHEIEVVQFQPDGQVILPCDLPPGTQVDWLATATFQDGHVDAEEGRVPSEGDG